MLSKSDSLKIFTVVTVTAIIIFVFLSYDTLKRVPDQTNEQNLSDSVIRGKHIWESNNCQGCHALLGEGGYYAPELTRVYSRRSEDFLRMFLKNPESMYPGKRKMVNYNFTDGELDDIIAFLKWIGEVDCNGYPTEPYLLKYVRVPNTPESSSSSSANRPVIFDRLCMTCHVLGGKGSLIPPAPKLDGIGSIRDKDYLSRWLTDPNQVKRGALMPKFPLSDIEVSELSEFLSQQK